MQQLTGLFTLTYVPNYFDILPMYLVVLLLMPLMMGLEKAGLWTVAAASVLIWLTANPYIARPRPGRHLLHGRAVVGPRMVLQPASAGSCCSSPALPS